MPSRAKLKLESEAHPHDPLEQAHLYLAYNAGTTEIEVLNWLHATIILLKPRAILETGAADGFGTIALASACKANGFGRVHSVELDPEVIEKAKTIVEREGLSNWVTYHCADSREFLNKTSLTFDLAFFDSICEIRAEECEISLERKILIGPAVFHDTSPYRTRTMNNYPGEPHHSKYRGALRVLAEKYFANNLWESTLSRGLTVLSPRQYPVVSGPSILAPE